MTRQTADRTDPALWKRLKVGDRVRLVHLPKEFAPHVALAHELLAYPCGLQQVAHRAPAVKPGEDVPFGLLHLVPSKKLVSTGGQQFPNFVVFQRSVEEADAHSPEVLPGAVAKKISGLLPGSAFTKQHQDGLCAVVSRFF